MRLWPALIVAPLALVTLVAAGPPELPGAQCKVVESTGTAVTTVTQYYKPNGQPLRFSIAFEEVEPVAMNDGSMVRSSADFTVPGAIRPLGDDRGSGLFEFKIQPKQPVTEATALFFARGATINIDLGLGKIVRPADVDEDGFIAVVDTYRRWRGFGLENNTLVWSLKTVSSNAYVESGKVDLNAMDMAWDAASAAATRWQGLDLQTQAKGRKEIRCATIKYQWAD